MPKSGTGTALIANPTRSAQRNGFGSRSSVATLLATRIPNPIGRRNATVNSPAQAATTRTHPHHGTDHTVRSATGGPAAFPVATYHGPVKVACAECGCVVDAGLRVQACDDRNCCCRDLPVRGQDEREDHPARPHPPVTPTGQ